MSDECWLNEIDFFQIDILELEKRLKQEENQLSKEQLTSQLIRLTKLLQQQQQPAPQSNSIDDQQSNQVEMLKNWSKDGSQAFERLESIISKSDLKLSQLHANLEWNEPKNMLKFATKLLNSYHAAEDLHAVPVNRTDETYKITTHISSISINPDDQCLYMISQENHSIFRMHLDDHIPSIYAGSLLEAGNEDGWREESRFQHPTGCCVDCFGRLWIADSGNNSIRMIDRSGQVQTIAGGTERGFFDGGARSALFSFPSSIAIDRRGFVFIGEMKNRRLRMLTPDGIVCSLAGSGRCECVDGIGKSASFVDFSAMTVDDDSNVFVVHQSPNVVRRVSKHGKVTTMIYGHKKDDHLGDFGLITDVCFDHNHSLLIADRLAIRKIDLRSWTLTAIICSNHCLIVDNSNLFVQSELRFIADKLTCDGEGFIYVVDSQQSRIIKLADLSDITQRRHTKVIHKALISAFYRPEMPGMIQAKQHFEKTLAQRIIPKQSNQ